MSTQRNNPIAKAIRFALIGGAAIAAATPAFAADEAAGEEEEQRIEVTGSRIKRTDVEGSLPVVTIDREAIDLSGQTSVADLLRNTTFNSFGSFRPVSGSSNQASAEVSLRGLGSGRTLVLIDGRRVAKSPQGGGSAADLNSLPLAAVERVEILTDGASSVYGSDAIGGVINVITRKDFDGMSFRYGKGEPDLEGGETEEGSITFGTSSDRGRILAGLSFNSRGPVFDADRDWSKSFPGDTLGTSINLSPYGNSYYNLVTDQIEPVPGCENLPAMYLVEDDIGPFGNTTGGMMCAYDYTTIAMQEAESENESLFVNGEFEINEDWSVYANLTVARSESFGRYAPAPDALLLPASSPNNTLGVPAFILHRYAALGPRDNFTDALSLDRVVGFTGDVGGTELDFGLRVNEYNYKEFGRNYLVRTTARAYLADGTYDIFDPYGNDESVLNAMKATITREGIFKTKEIYATATRDLFEMGAGTVTGLIGVESRNEKFTDQYDSLQEAGQIGGSAGNSAGGDRDVDSVFFEMIVPILDNLEMNVAGRRDKYSDYGSDFSPKVSFRFQPIEEVTLRASYGEGFRAPELSILTQKESFSADFAQDFVRCEQQNQDPCPTLQYDTYYSANAGLQSEQSKQYSLGVAFQPVDWFNGSIDFYNIELEDTISQFSAQDLINMEYRGFAAPPGLGVIRSNTGTIVRINAGYGNAGTLETDGFDLNLAFTSDLGGVATMRNNFQLSWVNSYEVTNSVGQVDDLVGAPGAPEFRFILANQWSIDDFTIAWNINHIDETYRLEVGDDLPKVDAWTTHDIQVSWAAPWNGEIVVGARNVTDEMPPLNEFSDRNYDVTLYDGYGVTPYIRYTQNF